MQSGERRAPCVLLDCFAAPLLAMTAMKAKVSSHIVSFLEALASERGASANTVDAYRRDLADYEA